MSPLMETPLRSGRTGSCIFKGAANRKSVMERARGNAILPRYLYPRPPVRAHVHDSPIARLNKVCRPPAVDRFVTPIVVDPINRQAGSVASLFGPCGKHFEIFPLRADRNASAPIILVAADIRVSASRPHRPPDPMKRGSRLSVRRGISPKSFELIVAATFGRSAPQIVAGGAAKCPASASAYPVRRAFSGRRFSVQHGQLAELFTRHVYKRPAHGFDCTPKAFGLQQSNGDFCLVSFEDGPAA